MIRLFSIMFMVFALPMLVSAQDPILDFDYGSDGPWNDPELTTMTVPKVANGGVTLDGVVSAEEYGGFESIDLIPGDTAWPLNWPNEREWDGPDDSSFRFYLAHDDDNLYIGVNVKDDVLSQDAAQPTQYWQDDAIELVIDPVNIVPPDTIGFSGGLNGKEFLWGAHTYFTYNEKMRGIDPETGEDSLNQSFLASVWTFGPDGDISSKGTQSDTGWMLEVRIAKSLMAAEGEPYPWGDREGETYDVDLSEDPISFAIGIDDDDGKLEGNTGFELQYWFPVTERLNEWTMEEAFFWDYEEVANGDHLNTFELVKGERLNGGSLGKLLLSNEITGVTQWSVY